MSKVAELLGTCMVFLVRVASPASKLRKLSTRLPSASCCVLIPAPATTSSQGPHRSSARLSNYSG